MSAAVPWKPAEAWWIRMRELGSAERLPLAPPPSSTAPMLAAMPMHVVATCGWIRCIVS